MWPESLNINVSRETSARLNIYHALLLKWQKAINLISPSTLKEAWLRHFADSAQIVSLLPEGAKICADIGSGAGFPGMVVALMCPDLKVYCIESDERKCQFLKAVSRETNSCVQVVTSRIEEADIPVPDVVTARALTDLTLLLKYIERWTAQNPELQAIFLKGEKWQEEVLQAREAYDFDVSHYPSQTDSKACVLVLGKIRRLNT